MADKIEYKRAKKKAQQQTEEAAGQEQEVKNNALSSILKNLRMDQLPDEDEFMLPVNDPFLGIKRKRSKYKL